MTPRLTYFSSRGRAELIRLVLAEAGVVYQEVSVGPYDPAAQPAAFVELRARGELAYDALPLWEEPDGFRLVQSDAIVRHLARTHWLYGATVREAARCDQFLAGIEDTRIEMRKLFGAAPSARPALREELVVSILPRWLGRLERQLVHEGGGFVVGASPSLADVALAYLIETLRDNGFELALERCPSVVELAARMHERPGIAAHLASPARFPAQLLPA